LKPWMIHFVMAAVFFAAGIAVLFLNTGISRWVGAAFAILFGARRIAVGIAERRAADARRPHE
jgi:hypothetical protein